MAPTNTDYRGWYYDAANDTLDVYRGTTKAIGVTSAGAVSVPGALTVSGSTLLSGGLTVDGGSIGGSCCSAAYFNMLCTDCCCEVLENYQIGVKCVACVPTLVPVFCA